MGRERGRLLRLVSPGQLRVAVGLHVQVRHRLCRLHDAQAVPQGLSVLVQGHALRGGLKARHPSDWFRYFSWQFSWFGSSCLERPCPPGFSAGLLVRACSFRLHRFFRLEIIWSSVAALDLWRTPAACSFSRHVAIKRNLLCEFRAYFCPLLP